jgi:hypothetical protein
MRLRDGAVRANALEIGGVEAEIRWVRSLVLRLQ